MAWQKMTDKEKKEYMDGKRKDAVTRLTTQVQALTESESWKEWLHWQAKFHTYSFCNAVLIKGQCPEASAVCGYKSVWEPAGYRIKKGEKAISIFGKPWVVEREQENDEGEIETVAAYRRYPILSVWDISQLEPTENAKPMPELAKAISGTDYEADLGILLRFAKSNGIEVEVKSIKGSKGGAISRDGSTMIVNDQKELNHNFRTVAHELAHYALHCQGRGNQSYQSGELDAEAVAFIVADARGLDTSEYSVGYVATWAGEADKFVAHMKARGTVIADAARWILAAFDGKGE